MPPDLTVGVACYNVADTISVSLASLIRQKVDKIEVLLIDDASSDQTIDAIESFREQFESRGYTFNVISNKKNVGVGVVRNLMLKMATGEFIGFLDPDDYLVSSYYVNCLKAISTADFLRTDHIRYTGTSRRYIKAPFSLSDVLVSPQDYICPFDETTGVDYPFNWSGIYRLSSLRKYGICFSNTRTAEDRKLIWMIHLFCESMVYSHNPGYYYHRGATNSGSLTSGGNDATFDIFDVLEEVLEILYSSECGEDILEKIYVQSLAMIEFHLNRKEIYPETVFLRLIERIREYRLNLDESIFKSVWAATSVKRKKIIMEML